MKISFTCSCSLNKNFTLIDVNFLALKSSKEIFSGRVIFYENYFFNQIMFYGKMMNIIIKRFLSKNDVFRTIPLFPAGRKSRVSQLVGFLGWGRSRARWKKRFLNVIVIGQRLEQTTDRTSTNFRSEDSTEISSLISKV